ncbi:unnamed protein product [Meloidogyne enterolobii]
MVSLVIFCTNAINIIAGINGVEVGQSLVITASIAVFNTIQVIRSIDSIQLWHHVLSLCFILPFIGTSTALFIINKYPAKAFVGDTYCYWAGMTIAVSALTGRFSKTLLLFLLPQVNFVILFLNSFLDNKFHFFLPTTLSFNSLSSASTSTFK